MHSILVIGCGNMGGALLRRWVGAGTAERVVVIDPALPELPTGVGRVAAIADAPEPAPDVVVVAVKPQIAAAALAGLGERLLPTTIVVSIMAGTQSGDIGEWTGATRVARAMPNTPSAIGKGMIALHANGIDDAGRAAVAGLFADAGEVLWLDAETQFDAVTAVSGSGPAYLYRFIEALTAGAEAAGLPAELAERLARGTVIGAAALADADPRSAAELRQAVTSPGGTTEAGLGALDADPGLPQLLRNAVRAATARSRELAENR